MTTYRYFPPTVFDVPAVDADTSGPRYRLFRHYGNRARGENVWELVDGTMTLVQPYPTVSVVDAQTQASNDRATYRKVFYGGHVYDAVTEAEAIALQAAGVATLDVNLFPTPALPSELLFTSDGRFLFLRGDQSVITTNVSQVPQEPQIDAVLTSDGFWLFLAGTRDVLEIDP